MPPNQRMENSLRVQGFNLIAGVDEVGVGSLAGPVLAAAVIFSATIKTKNIDDSKKLSAAKRNELFSKILREALSIGVGIVDWKTIDRLNILKASHLAMRLAIDALKPVPEYVLVDGKYPIKIKIPQLQLCGGDSKCTSIAAASIVAKVLRDKIMVEFDRMFSGYGFKYNKGYGTRTHLNDLKRFGPCPIHRRSYLPVKCALKIHNPLDFEREALYNLYKGGEI